MTERHRIALLLAASVALCPIAVGAQPAPEAAEAGPASAVGDATAAAETPETAAAETSETPAAEPDAEAAAEASEASAGPSYPPEIQSLIDEVGSFEAANNEYRADARRMLDHRYARRRRAIKNRYSRILGELSEEEKVRRDEAIERFDAFLARYPNNPKYTPDALFRLAELHFEKSNEAYVAKLEAYDAHLEDYDAGRVDDLDPEPVQDYGRTIELFERLIAGWPEYRNIDGAFYLKGYCMMEMGQVEPALVAFQALVDRFPQSRFAAETWTRIGEYYFDANALPQALAAYTKVLAFQDSPYFDKALYKLAWTHYRNDDYEASIARFRELIEFSDEKARKTGSAGSDLRSEAIQYLAVSLQEEDWNGDGEPDAEAGFQRVLKYVRGDKPYDVEVLRALIDIFFENAKYEESVATIRHLLDQFPNDPGNPEIHQQMITAYERLQRVDDAFGERDQLARLYGKDSGWAQANADNQKALDAAEELLESALIQAATWHHSLAQDLKTKAAQGDVAAEEEAIKKYRLAAIAYDNYLKQYPRSPNAYDLNFFYAECLYYSFRFLDAARQYTAVRDSELGTKYQELAGFSAILSHENAIRKMIGDGQLEGRPSIAGGELGEVEKTEVTDDENDGTVKEIVPDPIPAEVQALIAAREAYIEQGLNNTEEPDRLPVIAYKAGETYFDYKRFEDARRWFSWLIQRFPQTEVAGYAAGNIIETYRQANDWKKMAEWAEIIAEAGLGRQFDEEIRTLKVGALFKEAERLFAAEAYDEAADEYIRLVTENPGNRFADAALNNAAVAYEKTRRFESATRTYERIFRDYPDSKFSENALFRVGVNSERFYDFDKAIRTHLQLVEQYPQSNNRPDSLYQAALLLEQTQQYQKAARAYERYADLFPARSDTAETFYRAARVYEKLGDTRNQVRIYREFVDRYGTDPEQNVRVIESLARVAEVFEEQDRRRAARQAWQRVIDEFNRRGLQPGTFEARYPARAVFELVEDDFEKYEALELRGSLRTQRRILKDMQGRIKKLNTRYAEVLPYKSFEWTLAAFYRLGHIYQLFAEALYEAPVPESLSEDEQDIYRTQLEDIALPIEDEAVKRYEQAFAKAREFRVTNDWTKRILRSLNKYKPTDYPLFKEERRARATRQFTPPRLLTIPEPEAPAGEAAAPAASAPPAGDDEK